MTDLTRLRSLAESLNSPQSKRRETMAGVLYEARREVAEILAEMEAEAAALAAIKPIAWVIGRDNNANDRGFIDAMAWQESEFSTPLYALPEPPALAVKTDGDRT